MCKINYIMFAFVFLMNAKHLHAVITHNRKLNNASLKQIYASIKDLLHVSKDSPQTTVAVGLMNILETAAVQQNTFLDQRPNTFKPKRRNFVRRYSGHKPILGVPQYPADLPAAEPILPGHTLLRPSRGMLKSAVKYPLRDYGGAVVYGNLDNLGITYGKTQNRIRYSNFRKANNIMDLLQNAVKESKIKTKREEHPLLIIEIDPSNLRAIKGNVLTGFNENQESKENNTASEILDDLDAVFGEDSSEIIDLRRKSHSNFRDRGKNYDRKRNRDRSDISHISCSDNESSDDTSSDLEKNPGNPYTVHKDKYKQNWMWHHQMDGDHMNINPYAPVMNELDPTGAKLFFGRKWWYFNQDDYIPLRRR